MKRLKDAAPRYGYSDCLIVYVQRDNKDGTVLIRTFCGTLATVKSTDLIEI